jgi:hypothetical protein
MQIRKYLIASLVSAGLLVGACKQKPDQTLEYTIKDIEILLEGPAFSGSNDMQAIVPFSPEEVLEAAGLSRENITDVRVKSVSLAIENEENFDVFESILVQLTGGEAPLASVALLNPVPQNTNTLQPGISEKASFKGFKNVKNFYLVMDANLNSDYDDDITVKGDLVLLLDVKK